MKLHCFDIKWDTDDSDLPTETVIEVDDEDGDYAFVDFAAADALSEKYSCSVVSVNTKWPWEA